MPVVSKIWEVLDATKFVSAQDVADQTGVKSSTTTVTLNDLARMGYVEKTYERIAGKSRPVTKFKRASTHSTTLNGAVAQAFAEFSKERMANSRRQKSPREKANGEDRPVDTKVLLTIEVPGSDAMTLDLPQARYVFDQLKELFG